MRGRLVSSISYLIIILADNLFPKHYAPQEYETEHLPELLKNEKFLELSK